MALKEYDRKSKGTLDFEDFFRMVAPQAKQYQEMLTHRQNNCVSRAFEDVIG